MESRGNRPWDVFCFGTTNCDLLFGNLPKLPQLGGEEYCEDFKIQAGGAANTAMALARLGLKVGFYTHLGDDPLGKIAGDYIKWSGVSPDGLETVAGMKTSVTAVLSCGGERAFATYDKTMGGITRETLVHNMKKARHLHTFLGYAKGFDLHTIAREEGMTLSLDTGYDPSQRVEDYAAILEASDLFIPNDLEVSQLTGESDIEKGIAKLAPYCKVLVVKWGKKGCLLAKDGQLTHVPGKAVPVVDTCGAGDLFDAGFLTAWFAGEPLETCAAWGNAAGALSVTFLGGMDEAFHLENVKKMMK